MADSNEFQFRWVIKNFHMCTETRGECIESPTFFTKVRKSVVNFKLKLYPRGTDRSPDEEIYLYLVRDDTGPNMIMINLNAFLISNNGSRLKADVLNNKTFEKHQSRGFKFCNRDYLLRSKFRLPENTLTLECDLLVVHATSEIPEDIYETEVYDEVLEILSSDINKLLNNHVHSDLTLRDKGQYFYVNKAILKSRCPKLMKQLKRTAVRNTFYLEGTEWSDLNVLLDYLYSGKLHVGSVSNKMFTIFRTFALPDLRNLFPSPSYMSASSEIEVTGAKFRWVIEDISKLQGNEELVYNPFYNDDLKKDARLVLSVHSNANNSSDIHLKFRSEDTSSIRFQCTVTIEKLRKTQDIVKEFQHTLIEESSTTCIIPKVEFSKILCKDTLHLYFEISLSNGKYNSKIEEVFYEVKSEEVGCRTINNLYSLQYDLMKLYGDHEFADVTLRIGFSEIRAHKAILCARSKVFAEMFKEGIMEEQKYIVIKDMDKPTLLSMLRYIYFGCVDLREVTNIEKLYVAAKKYHLIPLVEECSKSLKSNFDIDNIEEILGLEDTPHYENLERDDDKCLIL